MSKTVALRIAPSVEAALAIAGTDDLAPLALAQGAVPLLWPALFDYEEARVRKAGAVDVVGAVVSQPQALGRARALLAALRPQGAPWAAVAHVLARELARQPPSAQVALTPTALLATLPPPAARAYVTQIVQLCDLWQRVRQGLPWAEARRLLDRFGPDTALALAQPDGHRLRYHLVGTLAELSELDDLVLSAGQAEADTKPEALAVGEHGLLLGRFGGRWKLMSSGCDEDLLGLWAGDEVAFLVGRRGTLLRLADGRCERIEVPTVQQLNSAWGIDPTLLIIAGEQGTVLVYDGKVCKPWPVPTRSALHAAWASARESIWLAGQETSVWRFDGYAWTPLALPAESFVSRLAGADGRLVAAGGSRRGGELFRLGGRGWVRDELLPAVEWIEGLWLGWDGELGLVPRRGPAWRFDGQRWVSEALPTDEVMAAAGGDLVAIAGTMQKQTVIAVRHEGRWEVETALRDLRVNALWVAGDPKPPRLRLDGDSAGDSAADRASATAGGSSGAPGAPNARSGMSYAGN
ncbi:MAG: hypothetical protein IPL40_06165 [Proteobacteria bacterium]|nr:hypothetical protein [Pseudomonadota bacterium]